MAISKHNQIQLRHRYWSWISENDFNSVFLTEVKIEEKEIWKAGHQQQILGKYYTL